MKNIEKIRNMSAEELARIIHSNKCDCCGYGEDGMDCDVCDEGIVKWLEQEAEKPSIFEPKKGETYYSFNYDGRITEFENINLSADEGLIAFGNACTDRSVMARKVHELKLWSLLWNFAEEHNDEMDWDDAEEWKYYIYFNHKLKEWKINPTFQYENETPHFSSESLAKRAIDEIVLPWERGEL